MLRRLESIRGKSARFGAELFSSPYLPDSLIWVGVLVAALSVLLELLGQPFIYWIDNTLAVSSLPFLRALLADGPLVFAGVSLVYLAAAWAAMALPTRRLGLVAWFALTSVHLPHALAALGRMAGWAKDGEMAGLLGVGAQALAALLLGVVLSLLLFQKKKAPEIAASTGKPRRKLRAWQAGLAGAGLLAALAGVIWFFQSQPYSWRPVHPLHSPGKRMQAAAVYDPNSQKVIMFGGSTDWINTNWNALDDMWQWDGQDWSPIEQEEGQDWPMMRYDHGMAYDKQRGVIVMFGGSDGVNYRNDIWEWDGQRWQQRWSMDGAVPNIRAAFGMYYDEDLGKVVVSGGYGGKDQNQAGIFYNDTWTWDGGHWTEVVGEVLSPPIVAATAIYDPRSQRAVMMNFDGLLVWSADHWERPADIELLPGRREKSVMQVLPQGDLALYGGETNQIQMGDLWLRDAGGWRQVESKMAPSPRSNQLFFYDPNRSSLIVYGGYQNQTSLDDMWEYPIQ